MPVWVCVCVHLIIRSCWFFLRYLKHLLYTINAHWIQTNNTNWFLSCEPHSHSHTHLIVQFQFHSRSVSVSLATFPIHFLSPSSSFTDIYWFTCNCCSTVVCLSARTTYAVGFFLFLLLFCCCLLYSILLSFKNIKIKTKKKGIRRYSRWAFD